MTGDILFLAHRLPYPPDRGDRIRSWHVLNALAKIAPVHVCALLDEDGDRVHIPAVKRVAASVTVERRRKSKAEAIAEAVLTGVPASVAMFRQAKLMKSVQQLAAKVSTIYAFSGQMAAYVPKTFGGRFIMDFVDLDSEKFTALGGFSHKFEARRLLAWETAAARRATSSLLVSQAEVDLFEQRTGESGSVLENGVDLQYFSPDSAIAQKTGHPLIIFTGQMNYRPNVVGAMTFATDVLPRIASIVPDVTFAIAGRNPARALRALAGPNIVVTGSVPDTRPWLAAADIVVAPLSLARGIQNKVLEGMAMARPLVVSRAAATGIDAIDGKHFVVDDDPAAAIVALLKDKERAAELGVRARARMVERYDWTRQMAPLAGYLGQ